MTERKLVAVIPCRMASRRLYAKPLQLLDADDDVTVLGHLLAGLKTVPQVSGSLLAISEREENVPLCVFARERDVAFCRGDETNVLERIVAGAEQAGASDILRVTSEDPFPHLAGLAAAWRAHVHDGMDVTALEDVPWGSGFVIYRRAVLDLAQREGTDDEKSAYVGRFARRRADRFRIRAITVPPYLRRQELRFSVDTPEDLIVCRAAYAALAECGPVKPLERLIGFIDENPELRQLLSAFSSQQPLWRPVANA